MLFELFCFDRFTYLSIKDRSHDLLSVLVLRCKKNDIENIEKLSFYFMDVGPNYKLKIENWWLRMYLYV